MHCDEPDEFCELFLKLEIFHKNMIITIVEVIPKWFDGWFVGQYVLLHDLVQQQNHSFKWKRRGDMFGVACRAHAKPLDKEYSSIDKQLWVDCIALII